MMGEIIVAITAIAVAGTTTWLKIRYDNKTRRENRFIDKMEFIQQELNEVQTLMYSYVSLNDILAIDLIKDNIKFHEFLERKKALQLKILNKRYTIGTLIMMYQPTLTKKFDDFSRKINDYFDFYSSIQKSLIKEREAENFEKILQEKSNLMSQKFNELNPVIHDIRTEISEAIKKLSKDRNWKNKFML